MAAPRQLEIWSAKPLSFRQRKELIRSRLRGLEYRQTARAERRRRIYSERRARDQGRRESLRVGPRQITIFGLTDPPSRPQQPEEVSERKNGVS